MAKIVRRFSRHENVVLITILVVIIATIAGITKGASITITNLEHILLRSSSTGVAAVGQSFVLLTAGIDISIGGLAMFCMSVGGTLMTGLESGVGGFLGQTILPMGVAIMIMLLLGLGIGVINGSLVSRVGVSPLIATLAMWQITKGGGLKITRGATIMYLPRALALFGQGRIVGVPVPFILFVVVAVVAYFVLYHTSFGKSVYAVGGNEICTWLSGINTKNIKLWVYVISGFLAGLAGLVVMARSMYVSALSTTGLELDSIAAVCIGGVSLFGGRGSLIGAIIGVMILGVINNGMNAMGLGQAYQDIVRGVIITIAVAIDVIRRR